MEFHQLRYFAAAATHQSITRAAREVHVSQPALSRQIVLLEEELGVKLFERIRKRIHLTDAGVWFLGKARQILCDAETAVQRVREDFGGGRRTLRLGLITPFLDDLVIPAVREFQQRHPGSRVSLFDLPPRALVDRLKARELDAALLGNLAGEERSEFQVRQLTLSPMALVLPEEHRFATRKSLKLAQLREEKWVSLSDVYFPGRRTFFRSACRQAGFEPEIVGETESIPLLLASVSTGSGVAILPAHSSKFPHAGCVFVPMSAPKIGMPLLLVMPPEKPGVELQTLSALIAEHAKALRTQ